jgi:hypothetical protein
VRDKYQKFILKPKERNIKKKLYVSGRIILKRILIKECVRGCRLALSVSR